MKNIKKYIINHLEQLDIKHNDHILLYSKISSFGVIEKHFSKLLLNIILAHLGKNGTLIMPSYTFKKKKFIFNINKLSQNYSTGILVKEFFKNNKIKRSLKPIHSHIGIGKKSYILSNKLKNFNSFGRNSDFDLLTKNNFKCVFLGCTPQESATYLIHLEYINNAPYRNKIGIKKKILYGNLIKDVNVEYFDRPKEFSFDYNNAVKILKKLGMKTNHSNLKYGKSLSVKLKDFLKYGNIMFKKNKYCLIKKYDQK